MNTITNNKSKYFVTRNREIAYALKGATNEPYYKFDNVNGTIGYSFIRTDEIVIAYRMLKAFKRLNLININI